MARFNAMVTEAQDTAGKQQASLGVTLGLICDALVRLCKEGQHPPSQVMPLLDAFMRFTRSDGLDHAFCRMVPASDEAALAQVCAIPDLKRRSAWSRRAGCPGKEDALVPFFLRAMQDPIVEVGHRAMHHFAKLPSSFPS